MKHIASFATALLAVLIVVSVAAAAPYKPTLSVTPSSGTQADTYTISGCGYDASRGEVFIEFGTQRSSDWNPTIGADGCISLTLRPFGGLAPGSHPVSAYQTSGDFFSCYCGRAGRKVASTSVFIV